VVDNEEYYRELSVSASSLIRNACLAHLLQLAIKDAWKVCKVVTDSKKLTDIISYFNRSPQQYIKLKELTNGYCLVKPCVTRWNALFYGFSRVLINCKGDKKVMSINNPLLEGELKQTNKINECNIHSHVKENSGWMH
jgi:hypothetical protein